VADQLSAPFAIERVFKAPRKLVYAALTQAEHLRQWMSPPGMCMSHCTVDARPGGVFHYDMRPVGAPPEAPGMWGKWTFRELLPPERIVVVVNFSDADGGTTRHPMAPQWPLFTLSTTTLLAVQESTLMRLTWCALDALPEERAIFDASHASMQQGWGGTMDNLERHLQRVQDGAPA
jgi:uncharacterized protein YndB with AHSA1/START domain